MKKAFCQFIIGFSVFCAKTSFAQTQVDPYNGNLNDQYSDLRVTDFFEIVRVYNSQNTKLGYFGQGWCSNLETKVLPMDSSSVKLVMCGAGQEFIYSWDAKTKSFKNKNSQFEYLRKEKQNFVRFLPSGLTEQFDKTGKLEKLEFKGKKIQLVYQNERILIRDGKRKVEILKPVKGLVSLIKDGRQTLEYRYDQKKNLTYVENGNGAVLFHSYDSYGRLIMTQESTAKHLILWSRVKYERDERRVSSLASVNGCQLELKYSSKNLPQAQREFLTDTTEQCGQVTRKKSLRQVFKMEKEGLQLTEQEVSTDQFKQTRFYSPSTGQTEKIATNGKLSKFNWNVAGSLDGFEVEGEKFSNLKFDAKCGQLGSYVSSKKGEVKFHFSTQCDVIKVSSAAQTYSIFYGKDKRISEIVDSKKEKLDLKVWQDSKDQNSRARFHHFFEKVAELEFPKKMIEAL